MRVLASIASLLTSRRSLAGVPFEIVSEISEIEQIAVGSSIRELTRLQKAYGPGRWRKLEGAASVRLKGDRIRTAELHWYEAHGIGRREFKIKRFLDEP
jgi:hypothetical protein